MIVLSKFYSSIAVGRAVIFIGDADGEIARDVARGACGVTVSADDAVGLADAIERLCDDAPACARMGAYSCTYAGDVRGGVYAGDRDGEVAGSA